MKRIYVTYALEDLRGWSLDTLTVRFNYRNHPKVEQEIVAFRNTYGDTFELRFEPVRVLIWTTAGGVSVGIVEYSDETPVEDTLTPIENATRVWSRGYVPCAGCGALLHRFLSPDDGAKLSVPYVALAYHAGRYCSDCAPKYAHLAESEVD